MSVAEAATEVHFGSLPERLIRRTEDALSVLSSLSVSDGPLSAELQDKYYGAVSDIAEVRIESLPASSGSFIVRDGVLVIAEEPVARLLSVVTEQFISKHGANDQDFDLEDLPNLLEKVFLGFVLHEIRHRTQGVEDLGAVHRLKDFVGRSAMAELDVMADRDAAWAYACLEAASSSRSDFLEKFREALFLSSEYFFRVFPVNNARHDKIERAMAVLLMTARLATIEFQVPYPERVTLPLDAPLLATLSTDRKSLAIYRGEPSKKLIGVARECDGVAKIARDLGIGKLDSALERSVMLMDRLDLLA